MAKNIGLDILHYFLLGVVVVVAFWLADKLFLTNILNAFGIIGYLALILWESVAIFFADKYLHKKFKL